MIYPDFGNESILAVDASQYACGAMLTQISNGQEHPIAYYSHTFQPCETRYATVEREFYAVVKALKHWKHYLYGHKVIVYSDQQSLSWGIKNADTPGLMKWVSQVNEFDVDIQYRPGASNQPADFLSRLPAQEATLANVTADVWACLALGFGGFDLRAEQRKDPVSKAVIDQLDGGSQPRLLWTLW